LAAVRSQRWTGDDLGIKTGDERPRDPDAAFGPVWPLPTSDEALRWIWPSQHTQRRTEQPGDFNGDQCDLVLGPIDRVDSVPVTSR
jgi:hypothetical protein